jgi:hypothetical protein
MRKTVFVFVGSFIVGSLLASSCGSDEPTTQSTGTAGSGTAGSGHAGSGFAGSSTGGGGAVGSGGGGAAGSGVGGAGSSGGGAAGAGGGDASVDAATKTDAGADVSAADDASIPDGSVFFDARLFEDADLGDAEPPPEEAGPDGGVPRSVPCSTAPLQSLRCNLAADACCWDSNAPDGQCSATAAACPSGYGKLRCDGPEDCPGQICCARRSRLIIITGDAATAPEYSSSCQDTCTGSILISAVTLCKRLLLSGNTCPPTADGGSQQCDPLSGLPAGFRGCHN